MRCRVLRPVGEPLTRNGEPSGKKGPWPEGYECFFLQSGTAALALALLLVKGRAPRNRTRVLLPAYGCPDLVAAVMHAGLQPQLIDTAANLPFMDLDELKQHLSEETLAVIGVHFLGLPDRIEQISQFATLHGAVTIEDSAQRKPGDGGIGPIADLVVMSFGRGKPAGALGGGALLVRRGAYPDESVRSRIQAAADPIVPIAWKQAAYNWLIRPVPYAMMSRIPGLGLGKTIYRPLAEIQGLDAPRTAIASRHLSSIAVNPARNCGARLAELVSRFPELIDLGNKPHGSAGSGLLRYPVLCKNKQTRDNLHAALEREGLGSSIMYGRALIDLPGVPKCICGNIEQARYFADHLITLPTHSDVLEADLGRIGEVLVKHLRGTPGAKT